MGIKEKLQAWAASPEGQKKLLQAQKKAAKNGLAFGNQGDQEKLAAYYKNQLIDILRERISDAGFEFGDYLEMTYSGIDEDTGQLEIHNDFDPEKVHRPSLYPDKYPDGVSDIVDLMNRGYEADREAYGQWHGGAVRSLRQRDALMFLQAAVRDFNTRNAGKAEVILNEKYD